MATLKEALTTIIQADITSAAAGSLGVLLGYNAVTKPNCFFFQNPPDEPSLPVLNYAIVTQAGFFPRDIFFGFTAWGNNFEAVLARLFALLHKRRQITATDYSVKAVLFDGSGPDLWEEDWKCYYRQDRYRIIVAEL